MKLSIVVPVFNELPTIGAVLQMVVLALPNTEKELVIVDDYSQDGSREWLIKQRDTDWADVISSPIEGEAGVTVRLVLQPENKGKGAALRAGFGAATGDVIVIQDADLEYDPDDWREMWRLIASGRADVVYGSRFYGRPHRVLYFHHFLGNKSISMMMNVVCNTTLSDVEVCYKMFRREVLEGMQLRCDGFGFEVEFTVKVAKSRRRWRLYEVGIAYYGRTYDEGKKISWKDGVKALWLIVWFGLLRHNSN